MRTLYDQNVIDLPSMHALQPIQIILHDYDHPNEVS
jgi:hypothetical protein